MMGRLAVRNGKIFMSVIAIRPKRFEDSRGWFAETWNKTRFEGAGITADFCQDNHSYSALAGTLRGLHFQRPPYAQAKLVRCLRGRVFDVAVDIRSSSPTFKHWVGVELTAVEGEQLFVPAGYAHGFLTLENDCEVAYKVDQHYAPDADGGIAWNDMSLAIEWPIEGLAIKLSDKDAKLPHLPDVDCNFSYDGNPLVFLEN
jgi:dTDP-4-dehydrorhamnose 3,5-epimerase